MTCCDAAASGALVVVMEFAEGGSLDDLLKQWKKKQEITLRKVWRAFLQVQYSCQVFGIHVCWCVLGGFMWAAVSTRTALTA